VQIFCRYFDRQLTYLQISATFMQIVCRYVDRQLTYLQISATFMQIFCRYVRDNQHICKISATFMQIFCRYCRPCCSYAAVLQQICDRYLQTFYIYVSLVREGKLENMPGHGGNRGQAYFSSLPGVDIHSE
jgi:hypothetical protein